MDLRPSSPHHRVRRRPSALKCLGISCAVFSTGLIGWMIFMTGNMFYHGFNQRSQPHRDNFSNITHLESANASSLVYPLIKPGDTFDVVLTIWARNPINETLQSEIQEAVESGEMELDLKNMTVLSISQVPAYEIMIPVEESVLATKVVKGITLGTRDSFIKVDYKIPLARFYNDWLYSVDLRAAVSIIPRNNPRFDRLVAISDWRPDGARSMRRIPNDLRSSLDENIPAALSPLAWEAVESFALSTGLITFRPVASSCNSSDTKSSSSADAVESTPSNKAGIHLRKLKRKHESHPYVKTRSHMYILNETRPIDRTVFEKKHKALRDTSCGQDRPGSPISRFLCRRSYQSNGHWETRLELESGEGEDMNELAYGPFLEPLRNDVGPLHAVRLPVTREKCLPEQDVESLRSADPEFIDASFTLQLSSMSARRAHVINDFGSAVGEAPAHNATDRDIYQAHDAWEQWSGLLGVHHKGVRPYLRFGLSVIEGILELSIGILSLLYWYSRETSTGLSLYAIWSASLTALLSTVGGIIYMALQSEPKLDKSVVVLGSFFAIWDLVPFILAVWLVFPFVIGFDGIKSKRWTIKRRELSHRERASWRSENTISWVVRASVFVSLFTTYWLSHHYQIDFRRPSHPYNPRKGPQIPIVDTNTFHTFKWTLLIFGLLSQLKLNNRLKTFAGEYKITALMRLATTLSNIVHQIPFIIGNKRFLEGFKLYTIIEVACQIIFVWQAVFYPKVPQTSIDEDEE